MSNEKHEEVAREIADITRQRNLASEQIIKSILSKHYDAGPELTKGMWVKYGDRKPELYIGKKIGANGSYGDNTIRVDGTEDIYAVGLLKPHTFTEPDLKLLDTEELDYLYGNDTPFYITVIDRHNSDVIAYYGFKTAHEAIESAFNSVLAENLRLKAVSE